MYLSSDLLFFVLNFLEGIDLVRYLSINRKTRSYSTYVTFPKITLYRHHGINPFKAFKFDKLVIMDDQYDDTTECETKIIVPNEIILKSLKKNSKKILLKYFTDVKKITVKRYFYEIDRFLNNFKLDCLELYVNESDDRNNFGYDVGVGVPISTKHLILNFKAFDGDLDDIKDFINDTGFQFDRITFKNTHAFPTDILYELFDKSEHIKEIEIKHESVDDLLNELPDTVEILHINTSLHSKMNFMNLHLNPKIRNLSIFLRNENLKYLNLGNVETLKVIIWYMSDFTFAIPENTKKIEVYISGSPQAKLPKIHDKVEELSIVSRDYGHKIEAPNKLKVLWLSYGVLFPENIRYIERFYLVPISSHFIDIAIAESLDWKKIENSDIYENQFSRNDDNNMNNSLPENVKVKIKKCKVVSPWQFTPNFFKFINNQEIEELSILMSRDFLTGAYAYNQFITGINTKKLKIKTRLPFLFYKSKIPTTIESLHICLSLSDYVLDFSNFKNLKRLKLTNRDKGGPVYIGNIQKGTKIIKIKNKTPRSFIFGKLPDTLKNIFIFGADTTEFEYGTPTECRQKILYKSTEYSSDSDCDDEEECDSDDTYTDNEF